MSGVNRAAQQTVESPGDPSFPVRLHQSVNARFPILIASHSGDQDLEGDAEGGRPLTVRIGPAFLQAGDRPIDRLGNFRNTSKSRLAWPRNTQRLAELADAGGGQRTRGQFVPFDLSLD